jgi:hypothetical protein
VVDLLELAQGVGVEVSGAGEQVQLAEELLALPGEQLAADLLLLDLLPRLQSATTSLTSGIASFRRDSIPIFRVIVDDGQPLQLPFMFR